MGRIFSIASAPAVRRRGMYASSMAVAIVAYGAVVAGCSSQAPTEGIGETTAPLLGDALAGITAADFAKVKANFNQAEAQADGLGPVFNERACGNCHANGASGGAGENVERRFGAFDNKFGTGTFDTLGGEGGTLRQLFSVGNFNNPAFH